MLDQPSPHGNLSLGQKKFSSLGSLICKSCDFQNEPSAPSKRSDCQLCQDQAQRKQNSSRNIVWAKQDVLKVSSFSCKLITPTPETPSYIWFRGFPIETIPFSNINTERSHRGLQEGFHDSIVSLLQPTAKPEAILNTNSKFFQASNYLSHLAIAIQ